MWTGVTSSRLSPMGSYGDTFCLSQSTAIRQLRNRQNAEKYASCGFKVIEVYRSCQQSKGYMRLPIIRPRRSRSAGAYSHQTFPCTICRSVCLSIGRSVGRSVCLSSALWINDRSHPAAVWHHRSDGSTDEAGIGVCQSVHGKGYFWGRIWTAPLEPMGTLRRTCETMP